MRRAVGPRMVDSRARVEVENKDQTSNLVSLQHFEQGGVGGSSLLSLLLPLLQVHGIRYPNERELSNYRLWSNSVTLLAASSSSLVHLV